MAYRSDVSDYTIPSAKADSKPAEPSAYEQMKARNAARYDNNKPAGPATTTTRTAPAHTTAPKTPKADGASPRESFLKRQAARYVPGAK